MTLILHLGEKVICILLECLISIIVLMSACPTDKGNFACNDHFPPGDSKRRISKICESASLRGGRGGVGVCRLFNSMPSGRKLKVLAH